MINEAKKIVEKWSGEKIDSIYLLPPSGSPRRYYRAILKERSFIVTYSSNIDENKTFISFTKSFNSKNLRVPEIFYLSEDYHFYIQSDLGDDRLFDYLKRNGWSENVKEIYKRSLDELLKFQFNGLGNLDLSLAYPRGEFDRQSIMWDLNYFKYYFVKLAEIDFHEQRLEDDFNLFADYLLQAEREFFLYRDFQTRNIMIVDETPYFIDYQGGRKGALHYDVASLLYDAKADIPESAKDEMLKYYVDNLKLIDKDKAESFLNYYYHFVLVRMLQALGAFGFRGIVQRKPHFIESIPFAIHNIQKLVAEKLQGMPFPELRSVIEKFNVKQFEDLI